MVRWTTALEAGAAAGLSRSQEQGPLFCLRGYRSTDLPMVTVRSAGSPK
jgi:hypothetical protein